MNKTMMILDHPENHFAAWTDALAWLCRQCEQHEISMEFRYHSGWFARPVGGGDGSPIEFGEPFLDESEQGYTIMVGMVSYQNDDGSAAFYPKPSYAVHDGLRLLKARLEEQGE